MTPRNGTSRAQSFLKFLQYVGLGALLVFLSVTFTPLPNVLARSLSVPARLETADAIVVLGGGVERGGGLSAASLRRTVHGVRLFGKGLAPIVVFSGGAFWGRISEGAAMAAMARELRLPSDAVLAETESTNTASGARALAHLLHPRGTRKILLVSDSLHMQRAEAAFRYVGFEVLAAPIRTGLEASNKPEARLFLMRQVLQELAGRVYYRLRGWI